MSEGPLKTDATLGPRPRRPSVPRVRIDRDTCHVFAGDSTPPRASRTLGAPMPPKMLWFRTVVRLAIAPVLVGALLSWLDPQRAQRHGLGAGVGLAVLGAIHLVYWWRPWPATTRRTLAAAAAMVLTNFALIHLLYLRQPLLWLYPALIVGAGMRAPAAVVGVALLALAAATSMDLEGTLVARALGPNHAVLLSVVLAGLGMTAVRQLIAVNADLEATKAELAELAVASERERLARELHDLLGRTLALIAVKAELASRLSATNDPSAAAELRDVQRLARDAVREVREAVTGEYTTSVANELEAARQALQAAGIELNVAPGALDIEPTHEATVAWALREAVTNVVKHSGASRCRIALDASGGLTVLEIVDDGRGPVGTSAGIGLKGLADRVHALGGTFEAGAHATGGFRLRVELEARAAPSATEETAP
jgi:two-component system sensor histidine kinase DesK